MKLHVETDLHGLVHHVDRAECYVQPQFQTNCTVDPSGNFAGAYEEYRYDALGRRILVRTRRDKWCESTTGCSHTLARTVWDGNQVLFEVRVPGWSSVSADTLEADTMFIGGQYSAYGPYGRVLYTHGLGLDQPLGVIRLGYSFGDGATNWNGPQDLVLYENWRGIPNAGTWTDGTTNLHCSSLHSSLCVLIRYPAPSTTTFFEPASSQPDSGWFGNLTTQQPDGSGQLYKRNRYYDPSQGRFTQEDPIGLGGGLNAYGFANGDPVNFTDPFGTCKVDIRYSKVAIGYHAYITTQAPDATLATAQAFRGGPEHSASGAWVTPATGGAASQKLGSHSNSSNRVSPGSGPGGAGETTGAWGPIDVRSGDYNSSFTDYPAKGESPQVSQTVVNDNEDCATYNASFASTLTAIKTRAIPYNPLTTNSNAVVNTMLLRAGITGVTPAMKAIGFGVDLLP